MKRNSVSSSHVAAVGWEPSKDDPKVGTLEVEYNDGAIYQYGDDDVPEGKFHGLREASSVGTYLLNEIKGVYSYRKIAGSTRSQSPAQRKFLKAQKQWE